MFRDSITFPNEKKKYKMYEHFNKTRLLYDSNTQYSRVLFILCIIRFKSILKQAYFTYTLGGDVRFLGKKIYIYVYGKR